MDMALLLRAVLSLAFVVGLILLFLGMMKILQQKSLKFPFTKNVSNPFRLSVVESKRIDAKNTLLLARCDDEEYLLLLGNGQSTLLQTKKVKKNG